MAEQPHLLACSDDILLLIIEHCEHSSIHKLSLTCKSLQPKCVPQLYRDVDLSSHNLGRMPEFEDDVFPEAWANTDDSFHPASLVPRQRSFLRTMTDCPEYAAYVRAFSWTLIWYDRNEDALTEIDYQLWTTFSRLKRIEKLDLAALPQDKVGEPYTRQIPQLLFPLVTELRLTGWMPHKLVANIFSSINLSELRVLSLDALQEEGNVPDGSPMPEHINKAYWNSEWRTRLCDLGTRDTTPMNVSVIFPGPMWMTMVPLIGKLDSLQYLQIRLPPLEENRMDDDCPDYLRYISVMVELVASVTPTLQKLVIDYARRIRFNLSPSGTGRNYVYMLQHLRQRQSEMILASFLPCFSTKGEWKWKSLRSISLKGFLQKNEVKMSGVDGAEIKAMQMKIEDSLSSRGVILDWSDDSPRPAFLFLGHDTVVSEQAMEQFVRLLGESEQA